MTTNEYEYVRREHGFDFMPPSQYVPSQSFSDETDEIDDPRVGADASEMNNFDENGSFEVEYDPYDRRKEKPPVVRGKPVDVKSMVRRIDKHGKSGSSVPAHRSRSHREPPVPVEQMDYHRHHKVQSRRVSEEEYRRRQPDHDQEHDYMGDIPDDVPKVPTAYSFDSSDSMDKADSSKLSRYEVEAKKNIHLSRKKKKKESQDKSHGHGKRRNELDSFSKPVVNHRRSIREPSPIPVVVVQAPIESRSEVHKSRRRSKSRDFREPFEDVPLGLDPVREASQADYEFEDPMGDYTNEHFYGDPRITPGYVSDDPALRMRYPTERRKSKGIFGRIKNGFLGEKSSKRVVERAWNQELRQKDDLLGNTKTSFGSDLSPYPRYQDLPGANVPYPYEDSYYDHATRMSFMALPPGSVQPPHPNPRRQRSFDARPTLPDYLHDQGPGQKRTQPSGIPFQTSRTTTPTLRANPDQRQRYIPMNTSMSKQYRSHHQGVGGAPPRGSPSLAPQGGRRGVFGCG